MSKQSNEFSIGTVARLVGVSTHTLRAWEKRHGLDVAHRAQSGHRIYNGSAIERLKLIKQAVDANYKISDIAALSVYELANLEKKNRSSQSFDEMPSQVLVYGEKLGTRLFRTKPEFGYRMVAHMSDFVSLLNKYPTLIQAVIFECNDIDEDVERLLYEIRLTLGIKPMTVFCHEVRDSVRDRLEQSQIITSSIDQFDHFIGELGRSLESSTYISFADEEFINFDLDSLAEKNGGLRCICPNNLILLLNRVDEFINYSEECEKLSPKDFVIHEHISEEMLTIRKLMMKLCQQLALMDGLELYSAKVLQ